MENASKALIIAGAILIAILLISTGILVMNSINKPLDEASQQGDSQAVQMFNSKFIQYAGKNKTAQDVKALLSTIISSNNTDKKHQVCIRLNISGTNIFYSPRPSLAGTKLLNELYNDIEPNEKYRIEPLYTKELNSYGNALYDPILTSGGSGLSSGQVSEIGYICVIEIGRW